MRADGLGLSVGALLLVAGCTTSGEEVCAGRGLQPGSQAYSQCVEAEYQKTLDRVYSKAYRPSGK